MRLSMGQRVWLVNALYRRYALAHQVTPMDVCVTVGAVAETQGISRTRARQVLAQMESDGLLVSELAPFGRQGLRQYWLTDEGLRGMSAWRG